MYIYIYMYAIHYYLEVIILLADLLVTIHHSIVVDIFLYMPFQLVSMENIYNYSLVISLSKYHHHYYYYYCYYHYNSNKNSFNGRNLA
jgi:hypothetical protein